MEESLGEVAIDFETHVSAIVHAIERIGAFACQIEHGL